MHDKYVEGTIREVSMPGDSRSNDLDMLLNPLPSLSNNQTSLTRIEDLQLPRQPGEHLTNEQRAEIQAIFLTELKQRANISDACRVAGIDRSTAYYWLNHDEYFASQWADAEAIANDALRREAWRRATDGVSEPIVSMGKLVRDETTGQPLTVQKYDTPLLMMLMRARMPEYRDTKNVDINQTTTINTSHQLTIDTRGMNAEELSAIRQIAQAMKEREQARIEKTGKHDQAGE